MIGFTQATELYDSRYHKIKLMLIKWTCYTRCYAGSGRIATTV